MDSHLWVLPWLSLIVGGATLAVALFHFFRSTKVDNLPSNRIPISALVTWIVLVIAGIVLELKLGDLQSVDVIGARGFALGSIGGALLVWLTSQTAPPLLAGEGAGGRGRGLPSLAIFGVALTELAIARLWLTHGEMTGLTAVAVGMALAVLCLSIDRFGAGPVPAIDGAVLVSTLAVAMQMGFTRAEQISLAYWPDMPLLITSGIAVGLLVASAIGGADSSSRRRSASTLPVILACLAASICTRALLHEDTTLKLLAIGIAGGALLWLLQRSAAGGVLGLVMLFAGISVAYAYWAGYGIAILMIGGWSIYAMADVISHTAPGDEVRTRNHVLLGPLTIGLIVAAHRAITLQDGGNLSSTDITDTWNLLAAGVGAVLPVAITPLPQLLSLPGKGESLLAGWRMPYAIVRAALMVTVPTLLIAYLFATQASDALVIGAAFAIAAFTALQRLEAAQALGATLVAMFVLQSMPVIDQWKEPSRHLKVEILAVIALVAVVLSLLPRRSQPIPAEA